ncbi:MAG: TraB/GumN family protein [Deltaproteobacteria bacterium]|jgi:uncharacterized protein YbaP (TraB family)|nr:TraB/GumN family protein [Deltaproteobacteria bacterium]
MPRAIPAALIALLALSLAPALAPARAEADEALLWRAVSPDGSGEIYLLGSVHMARTSLYPLKDILYRAFDRSAVMALELDPDNPRVAETMDLVAQKGFYFPPETLAGHLDPETASWLAPYAELLPGGADCNLRAWLAAVTLSVTVLEKMGYLVKEGVDRHFLARARERGMPFVELETPVEQLSVFADMSEEESVLFLRATLLEFSEIETFMDELCSAWITGDAGRFEEAFFSTFRKWPELAPLLDKVIFARNRTMFSRLGAVLATQQTPVFAVIGSGHLVGPGGIPALFAQAGWLVEKY